MGTVTDVRGATRCPICKGQLGGPVKHCPFCGGEQAAPKEAVCTVFGVRCTSVRQLAQVLAANWDGALDRMRVHQGVEYLIEHDLQDTASATRCRDAIASAQGLNLDASGQLSLVLTALDGEADPWIDGCQYNRDGLLALADKCDAGQGRWPSILARGNGRVLAALSGQSWLKHFFENWETQAQAARDAEAVLKSHGIAITPSDVDNIGFFRFICHADLQAAAERNSEARFKFAIEKHAAWNKASDGSLPKSSGALWVYDHNLPAVPKDVPAKIIEMPDTGRGKSGTGGSTEVTITDGEKRQRGGLNNRLLVIAAGVAALLLLFILLPSKHGAETAAESGVPVPADVVAKLETLAATVREAADRRDCEGITSARNDMQRQITDADLASSKFDAHRDQINSLNSLVSQADAAAQTCQAHRENVDKLKKFDALFASASSVHQESLSIIDEQACGRIAEFQDKLSGILTEAETYSAIDADATATRLAQIRQWKADLVKANASCSAAEQETHQAVPPKPDTRNTWRQQGQQTAPQTSRSDAPADVIVLVQTGLAARRLGDCDRGQACIREAQRLVQSGGTSRYSPQQHQQVLSVLREYADVRAACLAPRGGFTRSLPERGSARCLSGAGPADTSTAPSDSDQPTMTPQQVIDQWKRH